ncbi:MAG TPA: hypothetical protein VGM10_12910 [Actinocrinis sp.]|jgi:hypothetical protein
MAMRTISTTSVVVDGELVTLVVQTDGHGWFVAPDLDSWGEDFESLSDALAFVAHWTTQLQRSAEAGPDAVVAASSGGRTAVDVVGASPVERDLFAWQLRSAAIALGLGTVVRRAYEADVPVGRIVELTGQPKSIVDAILDAKPNLLDR